jgi:hypothetical protein
MLLVVAPPLAAELSSAQGPSSALEAAFQAVEPLKNFPFPALPNALDPHRRKMNRHSVLEPWAEQGMYVRVSGSTYTTVLVNRENALSATGGAAESLLEGVPQDAFAEVTVQGPAAPSCGVVYGQDETEVDGMPKAACVVSESAANSPFVARHGAEARTDPVELTPPPVRQSFFAVGDVTHLGTDSAGVPVIVGLDEEHVTLPRRPGPDS